MIRCRGRIDRTTMQHNSMPPIVQTMVMASAPSSVARSSRTSAGSGAGSGIATRCPETSSRCVLMPYGVQVINVSRSSPGTIFNRETSSGSITLIRSTSYPSVSSITLMYMKSPSCSSSSRVNINDLTRPRCPVTTVCESVPPTGRLVPYRCPAPTASTGSDVPCRIGSSTPILGTNTVPMMPAPESSRP